MERSVHAALRSGRDEAVVGALHDLALSDVEPWRGDLLSLCYRAPLRFIASWDRGLSLCPFFSLDTMRVFLYKHAPIVPEG